MNFIANDVQLKRLNRRYNKLCLFLWCYKLERDELDLTFTVYIFCVKQLSDAEDFYLLSKLSIVLTSTKCFWNENIIFFHNKKSFLKIKLTLELKFLDLKDIFEKFLSFNER